MACAHAECSIAYEISGWRRIANKLRFMKQNKYAKSITLFVCKNLLGQFKLRLPLVSR